MKKKTKIFIALILALIICITLICVIVARNNTELKTIKRESQLERIYRGDTNIDFAGKDILTKLFCLPFSIFSNTGRVYRNYATVDYAVKAGAITNSTDAAVAEDTYTTTQTTGSSKDYSTTNIQVENVDEADITKTDGDYIYSLSEDNVIITDVRDPKEIKIASKINSTDGCIPEDLILYKDKLVVISEKSTSSQMYSYYRYSNTTNTVVRIYNITDKENPVIEKRYELNQPYYTSRCIDNMLYVIASGNLRKENDKIDRKYSEDGLSKEIALSNIKYLRDFKTNYQTIISGVDLNDLKADIKISSYLINISNAYVSENNIYLLNQKYDNERENSGLLKIFGFGGIFGLGYRDYYNYYYDYDYYTQVYKFNINKDGSITYSSKAKIEGKTINQYSLDEYNNHLRIALYGDEGARVVILDEKLKEIGSSDYVAKGETMYSSRFMGNKAYLVTYKTTDPLFVIDLSNEESPRVLGELKIPGYSTYLHPYDENHIIGIGMQTEENIRRDANGKIISTSGTITGMKMALFDVSNVNNPIQMSEVTIGDRRTTSAILTNAKALLFSKEKELIAIPVNNYTEDFSINSSSSYSTVINSYKNYSKEYTSEGYLVYKINLEDGISLRGKIFHENAKKSNDNYDYYYYYNNSKLLRGLYIENDLYTISESEIKVNKLDTLEEISNLKITNDKTKSTVTNKVSIDDSAILYD